MTKDLTPQIAAYCRDLVRQQDRDRFMIGLTMPAARREALWALFAFNHEIAKTREVVSEPTLGLIRLQWWRDTLEKVYDGVVPAHEIIGALAPVIRAYNLPRENFEKLLDVRGFDLAGLPAASLPDLIDYADRTTTPLNLMALQILKQDADSETVKNISVAYALSGLLRAAPFHAAQKYIILPHGFSAPDIAAEAQRHLDTAGPSRGYLKATAALTKIYLRRMRRLQYDLRDPRLNQALPGFALTAFFGCFRT